MLRDEHWSSATLEVTDGDPSRRKTIPGIAGPGEWCGDANHQLVGTAWYMDMVPIPTREFHRTRAQTLGAGDYPLCAFVAPSASGGPSGCRDGDGGNGGSVGGRIY